MVDFVFTSKSVRQFALFAAIAVGAALATVSGFGLFAQDAKPESGPVRPSAGVKETEAPKGTRPGAKPDGVPQTARIEAAVTTTASAQDPLVPPIDPEHPLYLPLQEAYKAREVMKAIKDYECEFTKRESFGRRLVKTTMSMKLRTEPFSVYLKFLDLNAGREVIFVEGRNKNNLFVHEAGIKSIVGTLSLLPTSPDAMADNRYPVTMIGMHNLLDKIIAQWEAEGKLGEVKTQKYPSAKLPSGEECIAYESQHPTARKEFKFHITRLWIEKKTGIAIRVEQLGFPPPGDKGPPPVIEEYTYSKIKPNVPLTERDFDTKNPNYTFGG